MDVHPQYYALYQSGFCILGIGESIEAVMEDATTWMEHPIRLDEAGNHLTPRHVHDFSVCTHPYGEIAGDLYLRRCSVPLKELVEEEGGIQRYTVTLDGVLDVEYTPDVP